MLENNWTWGRQSQRTPLDRQKGLGEFQWMTSSSGPNENHLV